MNLITYLIENKLAKNVPHANAKIALLKLQDICNDEAAVIARVELYEAHKASKMHGKNDRAICAELAIKGILVPQPVVDMFARIDEIMGATIEPDKFAESELSNDELDKV